MQRPHSAPCLRCYGVMATTTLATGKCTRSVDRLFMDLLTCREYDHLMSFEQCQAIVFHDRTEHGGSAGLRPPRRCRRVAVEGQPYCAVHAPHAELQQLYAQLMRPGWERTVERYGREQERLVRRQHRLERGTAQLGPSQRGAHPPTWP